MVADLTNNTSVMEALGGGDSVELSSFDGQNQGGLEFMRMRGDISEGLQVDVKAEIPDGTNSLFNASTAGVDLKTPIAEPLTPVIQPGLVAEFKNG